VTAIAQWENFYVIVGSSAGALIGLQFVVITLIANMPYVEGQAQAGEAFGTPNIVHFGAVLLLSAVLSAPWHGASGAAVVWGLLGAGGIVYEIIVSRRMRTQGVYKPVLEDWLFHALVPFLAYATLAGSACAARSNLGAALFGVASAALLLLFVGIHNAWDAVTYHIYVTRARKLRAEVRRND
jgi:hypothetical protein